MGGLGIVDLQVVSDSQFAATKKVTSPLILQQVNVMFQKAPLWRAKPYPPTGRAESQDEAPFSLEREIMHFKLEGSESHTNVAISSCTWHYRTYVHPRLVLPVPTLRLALPVPYRARNKMGKISIHSVSEEN